MHRHTNAPTRVVGTHAGTRPAGLTWADLGLTPESLDWQTEARCRETDPDAFYPEVDDPNQRATVAAAKRVCAGCPVRVECLDYALAHREPHGIWGGHTVVERRHLQRQPAPPEREQSERDRDIAALTREGYTAREIAVRLGITARSVQRARARLRAIDTDRQEAA